MIVVKSTPLVMHMVTDSEDNAKFHAKMERFRKNSDWLQAHVPEVYSQNRGKCICVAGRELFVADTGPAVVAIARKAHPDDDGYLMRYIPLVKMERIYAH